MTKAEKECRRYLRAVRRCLNLPKAVKDRVMSDFSSSVLARAEAGQSSEAIQAELGSPKKAAAELNAQMEEYAWRKSPWRFVFLAVAVLSAGWLALERLLPRLLGELLGTVIYSSGGASVGVIGGADGPTAVFVTSPAGFDWGTPLMFLLLAIGVTGFLRLRKCGRRT